MKSISSKPSVQPGSDKSAVIVIAVVSVLIPVVVGLLLYFRRATDVPGDGWKFLPALNAGINSVVTVLLLAGKRLARSGRHSVHKTVMLMATMLSVVFLISYLLYHAKAGDVKYDSDGADRYLYLFILFSHILLSIVVVPLVLFSLYRGIKGMNARHRAVVKWTWPIWLYVSVTGVLVYLFAHILNPAAL